MKSFLIDKNRHVHSTKTNVTASNEAPNVQIEVIISEIMYWKQNETDQGSKCMVNCYETDN